MKVKQLRGHYGKGQRLRVVYFGCTLPSECLIDLCVSSCRSCLSGDDNRYWLRTSLGTVTFHNTTGMMRLWGDPGVNTESQDRIPIVRFYAFLTDTTMYQYVWTPRVAGGQLFASVKLEISHGDALS